MMEKEKGEALCGSSSWDAKSENRGVVELH